MSAHPNVEPRGVEVHTEQAQKFQDRYDLMTRNPYASTFTYGRYKIEELIEGEISGFPKGARALDVGCGTGFNVARLSEHGFDTVGIEPAQGMRAIARVNCPGTEIMDGDIERLPFPDASFDLVIAVEVLRYLAGPARAMSEVARVLRPGGTAIVTAAPRWSLNGYAAVNAITGRVRVPSFTYVEQSFLSTGDARRALAEAGFAAGEVHGVFLGPWHVLGRIAPRMLPRVLRTLEPLDDLLADRWPWRGLANHLVLVGRR
jgi:ubiquinone/menaquinone biosynthesis C-methylase UbiE